MAKEKMMDGGMCPCPHHKYVPIMAGILIVLGGIVKLMEALGSVTTAQANMWVAVLIILFGLGWLGKGACSCDYKR